MIQHNANLLANIEEQYGRKFVDILIQKHPHLIQNPTGIIGWKTLDWVEEVGFSELFSPGATFAFVPFLTGDLGVSVFLKNLLFRSYPIFISRPVFLSDEQLEATRSAFYDNGNYKEALKIFMRQYENLNEMTSLGIVKNTYKKVFLDKNYIVSDDISKIQATNISILGHGAAGSDSLGCSNLLIPYSEVVQIIKSSGVPHDVNIRLQTCHTGNGNSNIEHSGKQKVN